VRSCIERRTPTWRIMISPIASRIAKTNWSRAAAGQPVAR
jgi:hypothetical protein